MNELHLFAGAGGGILGGMLLGHTPVCAVEIEPYPRKVLLQRQRDNILPKFPIWDDICTFDGKPWKGKVDVVCGGFPCQDISSANSKAVGIEGERSGLWSEMARIVGEVRPKHVFVENSPMLVKRGLALVISDLAKMGYNSRWCVLGGNSTGGHCKGERLWLVASPVQIRRKGGYGSDGECCENEEVGGRRSVRVFGGAKDNKRADSQEEPSILAREGAPLSSKPTWEELQRRKDWNTPPKSIRVGYEVANRVDRIAAVGNGQDPRVASLAWQILTEGI
jgi:DNA (cytosine-5)-methyltransferase 1